MTYGEEQYWRGLGEAAINDEMVKRIKAHLVKKFRKPRAPNGPSSRKGMPYEQSMTYAALQQRLKAERMSRAYLTLAVILVSLTSLSAQTATYKLQWSMPDPPALAQSYAYSLKTSPTATAQALTVTCVASGTGSTCTSTALPVPAVSGLTVTATNAYGAATSDPVNGTAPAKPGSITVVVTVAFP